ncbi:MAG: hypothetical protein L0H83_11340 [Salinisphaera sp.]|nr:hypothetical protein [Salinisphaera sp.]
MRMTSRWVAVLVGLALTLAADISNAGSAMQELLETLHENGTIDDVTFEQLTSAVAAQPDGQPQTGEREPTQHAAKVTSNDGLFEFTSEDGDTRFVVGGRLQIEAAGYDSDEVDMGNGTGLRRARVTLAGTINDVWHYKTQFDFATGNIAITRAFISYTGLPVAIVLGQFKEPIGLQTLTFARYNTFIERALQAAFFPGPNIGLKLHKGGERYSATVGVFGERFNDNNEAEDPITDDSNDQDEGVGVTGRLTWAPFGGGKRVLHLGVAASHRELNDSERVRYRSRPESHITGVRLVDTGAITGVKSRDLYGFEAAGVVGPWSAQAEYMASSLDRRSRGDLDFSGWYVQTGLFLTGESRNYNPSSGVFKRLAPANPVSSGGFGAWQIAARLSNLDLTDESVDGGEERNLTLGVNWFLEPTLRLSFNYVEVLDVDGGADAGHEPSVYQMSAYVDF